MRRFVEPSVPPVRGPKMEQAERLRIYLTEMFAARMLESLRAGDSVVWGQGQITPTGIDLDGRSIRWKEITRIKIRNNGSTVIGCSGQGDVSLSIDAPNFWPGFAILKLCRPIDLCLKLLLCFDPLNQVHHWWPVKGSRVGEPANALSGQLTTGVRRVKIAGVGLPLAG